MGEEDRLLSLLLTKTERLNPQQELDEVSQQQHRLLRRQQQRLIDATAAALLPLLSSLLLLLPAGSDVTTCPEGGKMISPSSNCTGTIRKYYEKLKDATQERKP